MNPIGEQPVVTEIDEGILPDTPAPLHPPVTPETLVTSDVTLTYYTEAAQHHENQDGVLVWPEIGESTPTQEPGLVFGVIDGVSLCADGKEATQIFTRVMKKLCQTWPVTEAVRIASDVMVITAQERYTGRPWQNTLEAACSIVDRRNRSNESHTGQTVDCHTVGNTRVYQISHTSVPDGTTSISIDHIGQDTHSHVGVHRYRLFHHLNTNQQVSGTHLLVLTDGIFAPIEVVAAIRERTRRSGDPINLNEIYTQQGSGDLEEHFTSVLHDAVAYSLAKSSGQQINAQALIQYLFDRSSEQIEFQQTSKHNTGDGRQNSPVNTPSTPKPPGRYRGSDDRTILLAQFPSATEPIAIQHETPNAEIQVDLDDHPLIEKLQMLINGSPGDGEDSYKVLPFDQSRSERRLAILQGIADYTREVIHSRSHDRPGYARPVNPEDILFEFGSIYRLALEDIPATQALGELTQRFRDETAWFLGQLSLQYARMCFLSAFPSVQSLEPFREQVNEFAEYLVEPDPEKTDGSTFMQKYIPLEPPDIYRGMDRAKQDLRQFVAERVYRQMGT